MTSATVDRSEFRHVLLSGTIVGAATAVAVILFLLVSRLLPAGLGTSVLLMIIVLAGGVGAAFLPGFFAASRTTQGVASAAAMGLWGTIVFMAIDIILLRPLRAYPWTWDAVGGGSTWWYLPIWWMLGTLLAWMGAIVTAGRAARGGDPSIRALAIPAIGGGLGVGLGLGLGGLLFMPVAAGAGFAGTLVIFALIVLARRG
ncbi:MAG: hypothetical protein DMD59_04500 [Gemmatimonadetes bacterium]|nr:MAG: hypothetical protein DMD59_04500 [Gemmatimonadota bacterium]